MSYIYILSDGYSSDKYKVGVFDGDIQALKSQYTDALPQVEVHYSIKCTHSKAVLSDLKSRFCLHSVFDHSGQCTDWFERPLDGILSDIFKCIYNPIVDIIDTTIKLDTCIRSDIISPKQFLNLLKCGIIKIELTYNDKCRIDTGCHCDIRSMDDFYHVNKSFLYGFYRKCCLVTDNIPSQKEFCLIADHHLEVHETTHFVIPKDKFIVKYESSDIAMLVK